MRHQMCKRIRSGANKNDFISAPKYDVKRNRDGVLLRGRGVWRGERHEWLPENLKLITQNKREQQRGRRQGGRGGGREGEEGGSVGNDCR